MVVGITGGIGVGKSFVAKAFCSFTNTTYYHADEEAKKLINESDEIANQLKQEFGEDSYKNNQLDTTFISSIVFKDPARLEKLNSIVHPAVKKHFQEFIKSQKEGIIIYENAILFEINSDQFCDVVITVTAPLEKRISRIIKRDNLPRKSIEERIENQWTDEKKIMQSNYVIFNLKKEKTLLKVNKIYNFLTKNQLYF